MSQVLIHAYLNELAKLKKVSGVERETVVREAFKDLLKGWGRSQDLTFIPEYQIDTKAKERRFVDGALLHTLRVPFGYWEAKDSKDDLELEIEKKFRNGYPQSNIIFEDSTQAILIQHGTKVMRAAVDDTAQLEKLLKLFFEYARPEIEAFRKAVEQFKIDLPAVLVALREMIDVSHQSVPAFRKAANEFLGHARDVINPNLQDADVREMLIQHILTGDVFAAIFPGTAYHENNSVARELYKLEGTFFIGNTKHQMLKALAPYYTAVRKAAAEISTHHEKQTFLKAIYENFYKIYNPKAADRLGVVYTPNEIVRFMILAADWLCEQHFGRNLIDKEVHILDPATGTGTFVCELIERFAGQPAKLAHKYGHELHANEVAILPYYIANLNIEATYDAIVERYEEFPGLCFVDTLDNTSALRKYKGHIDDLFGRLSEDNVKRIRRQNSRRISVIIGNPPYNANQMNENENNKNREYPEIDKRIKETYIQSSSAQKTKLYDMYARFFRWAADRVDENGIVALVTNRSFIESRTFDGFRAEVEKEFNEIRIVDLGGDVRSNPKLSGTVHNVFGIQTGVAISFMVKKEKQKGCKIFYARRPEMETAENKLSWLGNTMPMDVAFTEIRPDAKKNWLNLVSNDFDTLIPLATKAAKASIKPVHEKAIFKMFSLGVCTARDEWVYGLTEKDVRAKTSYLIEVYNDDLKRLHSSGRKIDAGDLNYTVKWSRAVKGDLSKGTRYSQESGHVVSAAYRPFCQLSLHFNGRLIEVQYRQTDLFGDTGNVATPCIVFTDPGSQKDFMSFAVGTVFDLHFVGAAAGTVGISRFRVDDNNVVENITDWALDQFTKRYKKAGKGKKERSVTKESIFHYVYAVLHDPVYREKYAINLKRAFPRIPFYDSFWAWSDWGKALMDMHIGYESVSPYPLKRTDLPDQKSRAANLLPKTMLRAEKEEGRIVIDSETTLSGIPAEAWSYKLGNRSALEWILDQYKEKKPKDPTIREHFNTYRFADYKEKVIDLLSRVTTVSVETLKITEAMAKDAH